jgi:hypothetical protein
VLGRSDFTQDELDSARAAVEQQLTVFRASCGPAPGALEPVFFNSALLALDRRFVHRVRAVSGKDGNPLNEVELLADSLMNNGGVLRGNNVIKYVPESAVLQLAVGDTIGLTAADFERLAAAFFAELEKRFR